MRYLTLSADFGRVALVDEQAGAVTRAELGLSSVLQHELEAWNGEYQPIVPLDAHQRRQASERIESLDAAGRNLAARVRDECGRDTRVKYYSEGLMRLLP